MWQLFARYRQILLVTLTSLALITTTSGGNNTENETESEAENETAHQGWSVESIKSSATSTSSNGNLVKSTSSQEILVHAAISLNREGFHEGLYGDGSGNSTNTWIKPWIEQQERDSYIGALSKYLQGMNRGLNGLDYINPDTDIFANPKRFDDKSGAVIKKGKYKFTNILSFETLKPLETFAEFDAKLSRNCSNKKFMQTLDRKHVSFINNQVLGVAAMGINLVDTEKLATVKYIYIFKEQSTAYCRVFKMKRNRG